jgi:hypothetical protein
MLNSSAIMKAESIRFETLEECLRERDRVLKLRDSGYSDQGIKVKDAFCIKKE